MSSTSREEICGSVQSFLTRPRSLRLRSRSTSYGEGLSGCLFGPIRTIQENCKVCHTSCSHAAADKRYSPTSNLECFVDEGPVAGPSPLQQEHEGKAKQSRSSSLIWSVKARMSSFR